MILDSMDLFFPSVFRDLNLWQLGILPHVSVGSIVPLKFFWKFYCQTLMCVSWCNLNIDVLFILTCELPRVSVGSIVPFKVFENYCQTLMCVSLCNLNVDVLFILTLWPTTCFCGFDSTVKYFWKFYCRTLICLCLFI